MNSWKSHIKETLILAWPVCLSQFGHMMVGVVDTAMVGGLKPSISGYDATTAQAAVMLGNGLYILVLVFALGLSYGITPIIAKADTEKDHNSITQSLKHGLMINFIAGVILFAALACSSPLFQFMGQKQEVVDLAIPFFNVMIFSLVPLGIFSTFKQFTEGLSYTRTAMFITIGGNIMNVILNYILIYGKLGFPAMGVMGACWASFISRVLMAAGMWLYVYYASPFRIYRKGFSIGNYSKELTNKIFKLGLPTGLQWVFEVGAFSFAVIMIGWIGKQEQAAHAIALQLAALSYMVASGISAAGSVRVGNHLGTKDRVGIRKAGFTAFYFSAAFMAFSALLFVIFNHQLTGIFSEDEPVLQLASSLLLIAAMFQLSDGLQVVGLGILRGLNDVKFPTYMTVIAYWVIGLPISYILAFPMNMGTHGVWYGLLTGLTIAAVALYLRFDLVSKRIKLG